MYVAPWFCVGFVLPCEVKAVIASRNSKTVRMDECSRPDARTGRFASADGTDGDLDIAHGPLQVHLGHGTS